MKTQSKKIFSHLVSCALMLLLAVCLIGSVSTRADAKTETLYIFDDHNAYGNVGEIVTFYARPGSSGVAPFSYTWYARLPGESAWTQVSTNSTYSAVLSWENSGTEVYCHVTDAKGNKGKSDVCTMAVFAITKQPQYACAGANEIVTTSVEAVGTDLRYQWYYRGDRMDYKDGGGPTYSTEMMSFRSGRHVYCVIKDAYGNEIQSEDAVLSMLSAVQQPVNSYAASGQNVSVTFLADGTDVSYFWYAMNPGEEGYTLTDVTTPTYTVTMTKACSGQQVFCVAIDKYYNFVMSDTAVLSMLAITRQPENVVVGRGKTAEVSVEASGEGLEYQWYEKENGASNFTAAFVTTSSYSLVMDSNIYERVVYCVVTDQYGNSVTSDIVTLQRAADPEITTQPSNDNAASGKNVSTSFIVTGDNVTYQWYAKNPDKSKYTKTDITTSTYTVKMTKARSGQKVYCIATDKYGNSVQSDTVTLSLLSITKQPKDTIVKSKETAKVTVKAEGDGLKYRWYVKEPGSSTFKKSSVKEATYSYKMTSAKSGRQVYCVITDQHGNSITSKTVTMRLEACAKITSQPKKASGASGETVSTTVKATGDGLKYQWYYKDTDDSKYTKSSDKDATYSCKMTAAKSGRKVYCKITDKYGNTVKTKAVTLSRLSITQQPSGKTVSSYGKVSTTIKASGDGLKYRWYIKDSNENEYTKTSNTSKTYSFELSSASNGRSAYCVVTDKYGNSVKSDVVTFKYKAPSTSNSSTGSSNTGSSDSVLDKKECTNCRKGRCKKCGGDGEYETYMAGVKGSVTVKCKKCNNGSCRDCGGDGYK